MTKGTDDLEAVRSIVKALESFSPEEQERIIRWAREKLGLTVTIAPREPMRPGAAAAAAIAASNAFADRESEASTGRNIKTFIAEKNPQGDGQFAAAWVTIGGDYSGLRQ